MGSNLVCSDEKMVGEGERLLLTLRDAERICKDLRTSLSRLVGFVSEKTGHDEACLRMISMDLGLNVNGEQIPQACSCDVGWDNNADIQTRPDNPRKPLP